MEEFILSWLHGKYTTKYQYETCFPNCFCACGAKALESGFRWWVRQREIITGNSQTLQWPLIVPMLLADVKANEHIENKYPQITRCTDSSIWREIHKCAIQTVSSCQTAANFTNELNRTDERISGCGSSRVKKLCGTRVRLFGPVCSPTYKHRTTVSSQSLCGLAFYKKNRPRHPRIKHVGKKWSHFHH